MPKDLTLFRAAMLNKFLYLDEQLPDAVQNHFITNMQKALISLCACYEHQLTMQERLPHHVTLVNEACKLKCRYIQHYLTQVRVRAGLEQELWDLIKHAIQTAHPISDPDINTFLNPRISSYVAFVLVGINKDLFRMPTIYEHLLDLIMDDIVANIKIECGYDVYSTIRGSIEAGLRHSNQEIDANTKLESIGAEVKRFYPEGYRYDKHYTERINMTSDPCTFLHFMHQIIFNSAQERYNATTVRRQFPKLFAIAEAHQQYIMANRQPDGRVNYATVAAHYKALKTKRDAINHWVTTQIPIFIAKTMIEEQQGWAATAVHAASNNLLGLNVELYIREVLDAQLASYFTLPTSLPVAPQQTYAPPRTPSP